MVASEAVATGESRAPAHRHVVAVIAAGGAIGGLIRGGVVKLAPLHEGHWPWATFCVNIAGCLILGFAVTLLLGRRRPPLLALAFVGVGICGALTTFSTLELELARHDPRWPRRARARLCGRHPGRRARSGRARERGRAPEGGLMGTAFFVLAIAAASAIGALSRFAVHEWFRLRHAYDVPVRHPGRQSQRLAGARLVVRPRCRWRHGVRSRHGRPRLVHDVLDLDVRERAARRGGAGARCGGKRRNQPRRRAARGRLRLGTRSAVGNALGPYGTLTR